MLRIRQKSSLLAATLVAYACSGGTGVTGAGQGDSGDDGNSADGTAWITGNWTGTFELKTAEPDATSATAKFVDDDAETKGSGTFEITLPQKDGVNVKGKFQDFAAESLMLTIEESGVSSLGIPGSTTSVDYDLMGNALKIYNERALIRLVRDKSKDDEDGGTDDGAEPKDEGLNGSWACKDRGNVWRVTFKSATEFSIDIYDAGGDRASTWMDGTIEAPADTSRYDGMMTVTRAELDKYNGLKLAAKRVSKTSLNVTRFGDLETELNCETDN